MDDARRAYSDQLARRHIQSLRAQRYAARPGAPGRAGALQRLRENVESITRTGGARLLPSIFRPWIGSDLERLQQAEREGHIRGMLVAELEEELRLARELIAGSGTPPTAMDRIVATYRDESRIINDLRSSVQETETAYAAAERALRSYEASRAEGRVAGRENVANEQRYARLVGPPMQRLRTAWEGLRRKLSSYNEVRFALSPEQKNSTLDLSRRAGSLERRADTLFSLWVGYTASAYDIHNQSWLRRAGRQAQGSTLRAEHTVRDHVRWPLGGRPGGELKWYHWIMLGTALSALGYVGVKVALFAVKQTPHYQLAATTARALTKPVV